MSRGESKRIPGKSRKHSESRSEKEQGAHGGLQVVQQSWKMPSGKPLTKPEM